MSHLHRGDSDRFNIWDWLNWELPSILLLWFNAKVGASALGELRVEALPVFGIDVLADHDADAAWSKRMYRMV